MTGSKLSDSEKHDVARLYREPGETTSTLAERYGVSSTTIRRALKSSLSQKEYATLTNQKQTARWLEVKQKPLHNANISDASGTTSETATQEELDLEQPLSTSSPKRLRKRSSTTPTPAFDQAKDSINGVASATTPTGLENIGANTEPEVLHNMDSVPAYDSESPTEDLKEFLEELDEELDDGLEELNDEDLEDGLEPLPLDPLEEEIPYTSRQIRPETLVNVLPLSEALIPRTCYLVVDRSAELIARPLKEFCDLGQIPLKEVQEKTLPVFDNHRVARRFSNRSQRVIKIPNGDMLQKACSQLYAKGITRLLINGQVYSL